MLTCSSTIKLIWSSGSSFSQPFNEECISKVLRIGIIIIFRLCKLWKAKFFILCDICFWWGCRGNLKLITLMSHFHSIQLLVLNLPLKSLSFAVFIAVVESGGRLSVYNLNSQSGQFQLYQVQHLAAAFALIVCESIFRHVTQHTGLSTKSWSG